MRGNCFYILAGDTSADLLAGHLMRAVHSDINKPINWIGIGGEQMQQQGLETSIPMSSLSVIGILDAVTSYNRLLKIAKEPISMESPVGDDEDSHLGDFIEDENAEKPLDETINTGLSDSTREILSSLTPREAKVLRMRFGVGMNTDHTLEEVGLQFSVTRERIRQIEAKALRKLKHPSRSKQLKSFLES